MAERPPLKSPDHEVLILVEGQPAGVGHSFHGILQQGYQKLQRGDPKSDMIWMDLRATYHGSWI